MVTPSALAELALDLGKASFDNSYFSVATLQTMLEDRVSALAHRVCGTSSPLPGVVDECIGLLRRTRKDFKETVDRCVLVLAGPLRTETAPAGFTRAVPPRTATGPTLVTAHGAPRR
jgi:hypothetical protein